MKKNFKLIIMGVAVLSVLYITACARKDKAKESAQADKDIVVMSFSPVHSLLLYLYGHKRVHRRKRQKKY